MYKRGWNVAPFVGAWIEIIITITRVIRNTSLRSSERGLKLKMVVDALRPNCRRSVRRSVD